MVIEKEVEEEEQEQEEEEEGEEGKQICIASNKEKITKLRLQVDTRE